MEGSSEQGGRGLVVDSVNCTTPRITVRVPVPPEFENAKRAEKICPDETLNVVALPIVAPAEFTNEIEPAQSAAVPSDEFDARLTTLISAVSVAPTPTGGKIWARVAVVAVCANAEVSPVMTRQVKAMV